MKTILRVLVGSRAHGLAEETSDYDYRGVFVQPTQEILKLGGTIKQTSWIEGTGEGKQDDTAWEIGHYLHLATHCNPTILEVLAAPVQEITSDGEQLRSLLPYLWHPQGVRDAFIGYGLNQRKKLLENKDNRPAKYAVAYLRVLYQALILLREGRLIVDFMRDANVSITDTLRRWRQGNFTPGEVVDVCREMTTSVEQAALTCVQRQDLRPVNAFLLNMRRTHWDE